MRSRFLPSFPVLALTLASVLTPFSYAAPPNRIASISANRTAVPNTVSGRVKHATDLGAAPGSKMLTGVTLRFSMTTAQQSALSQLLSNLQNPSSPQYHQWLTPEQFGAQFGLSSTDIATVSAWLSSQGLKVTEVARSGTFIRASGTVAQVETAFSTSIHTLQSRGDQNISNVSDPKLPSAIANVVTSITGLNDFRAKPRLHHVKADFTSSSSGDHYVAPGDFYTMYNVTPLLGGTNVAGTSTWVGSAYNIAVLGQVQVATADITAFRSASGLSTNLPTLVLDGTSPGYPTAACLSAEPPTNCEPSADDLAESDLDLEWSGAVSPSSSIAFVYSEDIFNDSLPYSIDNDTAPIVTISYGLCEADFGPASMASFNQLFQQANAQGQTVINSAGDSGATSCDGDDEDYPAILGLSVSFPASSPYVTAVGGTMFNEGNATGATTYWSATNGTTSGSALSYIPEIPWNESSITNGLGAGGGGASSFFTKPAWQTGAGVPNDGARDVPDVSFNAASIHDPYLYCSAGFCTSGYRDGSTTSSPLLVAGGTSFGAPSFAGVLALVEQKLGARIGNANPYIYGLAALQSSNSVYHDVTSGNNNSQCVPGTPNCTSTATEGYTATANYDLATGWGSVNVANMANSWTSATPTGVGAPTLVSSYTYVSTTSTAACGVSGTLALTVTVANGTVGSYATGIVSSQSSTTTPTGMVQLTVDGVAFGTPQPLVSGALTNYSLNVGSLTGLHTIGAIYLGDAVYAGSSGQLGTVTSFAEGGNLVVSPIDFVSSTQKDFSLTPCTAGSSAIIGSTGTAISVTIIPANGFTGTVTLSAGAISSASNTAPIGYSFSVSPVTISAATGVPTSLTLYAYQNVSNESSQPVVISALHNPMKGLPWYVPASGSTLACVFLLMLPKRRRWGALLALVLSVAAITASGCSNSVSSSGGSTNPTSPTIVAAPAGIYLVTLTGTSGNLVHTSTVTFTVNP
jgi:Pro-kumamolisin, activation domain